MINADISDSESKNDGEELDFGCENVLGIS